jgi:UDP-GlcNAc3NAcA epimerase
MMDRILKVVTIIGARPQFIKAAVVSRHFAKSNRINEIIVHTGQHFDKNMSDVFFDEMSIPKPNINLAIHGLNHGAMTGQMLEKIESFLIDEQPDWVLVYGDTNSTLAGALAAKKLHIKVAHVEAGLRSYNMKMPEEINRILTDRISDILFCPTINAINNLDTEGYKLTNVKIIATGDVMQDAAIFYAEKAHKPNFELPDKYILCTIHRAENTDDPKKLYEIFMALNEISKKIKIVLPLHPRTKSKLLQGNFDFTKSTIMFIEPVGYLEMIYLLKHCVLVMTDSGGLQKEAYFFQKRCVVLREETEWMELIDNKFNVLVGYNYDRVVDETEKIIDNSTSIFSTNLYGNGNAGEIILNELLNY